MTWTNPLDKIPQLRVDWANHIFWSGITGTTCLLLGFNPLQAFLIALAQSLIKKACDFFIDGEGWGICIAKGFVSPLFPFAFYISSLHLVDILGQIVSLKYFLYDSYSHLSNLAKLLLN